MITCESPSYFPGCPANSCYREAIGRGARTLNALGKAMGDELDSQNRHIERTDKKVRETDRGIMENTLRLGRIR